MQNTLESLYTYWNGVRVGRLAPRRLEIEPASIAPILADTFMLERVHDGSFQYRLAGTRVCDTFGGELRGQGFLQDFQENDRHLLQGALRDLTDREMLLHYLRCLQRAASHRPVAETQQTLGRALALLETP